MFIQMHCQLVHPINKGPLGQQASVDPHRTVRANNSLSSRCPFAFWDIYVNISKLKILQRKECSFDLQPNIHMQCSTTYSVTLNVTTHDDGNRSIVPYQRSTTANVCGHTCVPSIRTIHNLEIQIKTVSYTHRSNTQIQPNGCRSVILDPVVQNCTVAQ